MGYALLWIPATLVAAAAQTARNAMQRRLTELIGTVGATQVRFLYGLPFAILFLGVVLLASGEHLPGGGAAFAGYLALGAGTQIAATVLMLAAMSGRSFSVVTALLKTEPVLLAIGGFLVLGDRLSPLATLGIAVATGGVLTVSWSPRTAGDVAGAGWRPILLGIAAGGLFAFSAIGFRGAILALDGGSFLVRASTALAGGLALQTFALALWLGAFDRRAFAASLREWRSSLLAGFAGAFASQFWFIGFALTAAANVRTLALVEVIMALAVSRRFLAQSTSRRELAGLGLITGGVLALLLGQA
ncbi:MAG: DMT family transporter [Methylobacteriaceae bacterium]|nr:DMT family transporter [Methylobacteriaceae bacterium]